MAVPSGDWTSKYHHSKAFGSPASALVCQPLALGSISLLTLKKA